MSINRWKVFSFDKNLALKTSKELNIPMLLAVLLQARGFTECNQISEMFNSDNEYSNPLIFKDMKKAADRITSALDNFEKIAVYGDYDADGVTSTAMLYSYLESYGANVMYYIPHRETEGYGLNINAIDKLNSQGVQLIITVDNGISSIDEVSYADSLNIDVVITDHHRPREVLPNACAVVDPYRNDCESPYKYYSGVGVAFKLITALEGPDCDISSLLENYADLVAIGTIGDIVPLTGENRNFVKYGLKMISHTDRIGLAALIERCGMEGRRLTSGNIAFTIVPRINATGRISSPDKAVRLLVSEYPEEAAELSEDINDDNEYRRQIENEIYENVIEKLKRNPKLLYDRVLVIEGENWHQGVIGIVSSRITEKYGKPSIIISCSGNEAKGSGRSIEGFSLFKAICSCAKYLTKYGGHTMAAGLTMPSQNISEFRKAINEYAMSLESEMPIQTLKIDCLLNPNKLNIQIPKYITLLEPFGMGNPTPLFGLYKMKLTDITPVGGGKHLRLSLSNNTTTVRCMKFGTTLEEFSYCRGDIIDVAVILQTREYNGNNTLSIIIKDIKLSQMDCESVIHELSLYEKAKREEKLTESEYNKLVPDREVFAKVYRSLRNRNGFLGSVELLLYRLKCEKIGLAKILIALDVFSEYNLICLTKNAYIYKIDMVHNTKKVDIFQSRILNKLKNLLIKDGE